MAEHTVKFKAPALQLGKVDMVFLKSRQHLFVLFAMVAALPFATRMSPAQSLGDLAREERAKKAESKEPGANPGRVYTDDNFEHSTPKEGSTASKEATEATEKSSQLYQKLARARGLLRAEEEKLRALESEYPGLRVQSRTNPLRIPKVEKQRAAVEVAKRGVDDLERDLNKETAEVLGNQNNDLRKQAARLNP